MSTQDTKEFDDFHNLQVEEIEEYFKTDTVTGLPPNLVTEYQSKYGPNTLGDDAKMDYKAMVIHQICNAMILVLIISMVISFAIHDWITGGVITAVIAINVVIGIYQEYKASKTMNSLKQLSSPSAQLIRSGKSETVPSKEVVPGDICLVKVGDTIPADLRLFECSNFETDEALLTGESLPVMKDPHAVYSQNEYTSVGDRLNIAYSSSTVVKGRAKGIVIKTALSTEIGKIAKSLRGQDGLISKDPNLTFWRNSWVTIKQTVGAFLGTTIGTPLHRKLSKLAILLFFVAVIFAIVVMASQEFKVDRGIAVYAICVALSMIPSSLVVVLTITMSVGAAVMASRHVIIRKLDSLEALGAVNDICSDKTGTLTQGKMVTRRVWIPNFGTLIVGNSNEPFNPNIGGIDLIPRISPFEYKTDDTEDVGILRNFKSLFEHNSLPSELDAELFKEWLNTATLANIANVFKDWETDTWKAHGDPTEIAIQVFATKMDLPRSKLTGEKHAHGGAAKEFNDDKSSSKSSFSDEQDSINLDNAPFKHLAEFPFDSTIKKMSTIYESRETDELCVFTKGAFEGVLNSCEYWYGLQNDELLQLTETDRKFIRKNVDTLSAEGLRVLAFASKSYPNKDLSDDERHQILKDRSVVESKLTFTGLIGIYDPPRSETAGAVKMFHSAGINVHMLTGDFPGTAKAIAQEVGILPVNLYHYPKDVVDIMVMTGLEFDDLSDTEIDKLPVLPLVIARCSPQTKVRMIEALHRREKFCAMTGDGVNDSPSLKMANVGIAMGINGSDVAKDASDIVLSDDNFASILNAVEEGRRMSDNIQKFVLQLLAENVAQALYLIVGLAFQDKDSKSVFPLSPVEVLWIIVVTSCFPAMGLGVEKAAPDLMERPPNDSKAGIFTWEIITDMFVYGVLMAGSCMGSFTSIIYGNDSGNLGRNCNKSFREGCRDVFRARSSAFATMTWCALILAWEVIDLRRSFFRMTPDTDEPVKQFFRDVYGNKFLFWSVIFGFASTFPVVYIPVINDKVFLHKGIGYEWGIAIAFTVAFWITCELYKYCKRLYYKNKSKAQNPQNDLEKSVTRDPFHAYSSATTLQTDIHVLPKE
ncbi:putative Na(+)-exporting P-type ATPase ENA5 KNAG_0H01200 [Huiozyma naganishii CBS 8797]|uniref:P-type Na(+) transporter n=1 Tax=Huiozyma naganishii (strain ATCC MYA-139 / BCRC 22969 / CBS 8797 / KCTC 17520 / NBRC 10181 / NCYC 3082 / Yp74L-3) TaxID=1071383 RepID=J7RPD0_HUIN7|nr:hypothetical protein KNAG_0H01200 [Kazachstania naganishii CBS 8797]CCK71533.1 hypothetical protein KNAG_0H01200 [Kazachstania naganishii CBS 8797]